MADQFTDDQVAEAKETFQFFDKDGNGNMSREELGDAIRLLGQNPTREELQDMLNGLDEDNDGTLSLSEFLNFYAKSKENPNGEESLREAFRTFDEEGKGKVTLVKMRQIMTDLGDMLPPEDVDAVLADADVDGNGEIDIEEFVAMMTRK